MSVQDLLQNNVQQVFGPNLRLVVSTLPSDYTVERLIGQLNSMKDLDEFLAQNDNADGVVFLSSQPKRQVGFYVKQYENLPPVNEFLQRGENDLKLRERGIPINQARLKLFEQQSEQEVLPLLQQFTKDFQPNNSS